MSRVAVQFLPSNLTAPLPMGAYVHATLTRRRDHGTSKGNTVVFDVAEPKKLIPKIDESSGVFFSMHDLRAFVFDVCGGWVTMH